jgi:hypothetical protein
MERGLTPDEIKALINRVGVGLRTQHSNVLCGEIPDRIAELLLQLDPPTAAKRADSL